MYLDTKINKEFDRAELTKDLFQRKILSVFQ